MSRRILLWATTLLLGGQPLAAQSLLEHSPNVTGVWTLQGSGVVFIFAHRFDILSGGDELVNVPTLSLAHGLPLGLMIGLDYSSNSEINLFENETQYYLKRAFGITDATTAAGMVAYNSAAESFDGALIAQQDIGPFKLFAEGRAFSDMFGTDESGFAGTIGAGWQITPYLAVTGDVGQVFTDVEDENGVTLDFGTPWSAGVAIAIPGSPHTLSLQATNAGPLTLQGMSREKQSDVSDVRYGFVFTVPLGTASQWARIFRPAPVVPPAAAAGPATPAGAAVAASVDIRNIAYQQQEVRIRAGQSVEWVNLDPVVHTVTGRDGNWGSELLNEGQRYVRRFEQPGRYPYFCIPHPQMTAVVVVEP